MNGFGKHQLISDVIQRNREAFITSRVTDLKSCLVGWFGFNGPLRQYLYPAVYQREGERGEKFNNNCTRGHIFRIIKPRSQKNLRLNSFSVRCINKWNTLSEKIVCSDTVIKFKMRLDKEFEPDRYNLADIY